MQRVSGALPLTLGSPRNCARRPGLFFEEMNVSIYVDAKFFQFNLHGGKSCVCSCIAWPFGVVLR